MMNTDYYCDWTELSQREAPGESRLRLERDPPDTSVVGGRDLPGLGDIMPLLGLLEENMDVILPDAERRLERCHLPRYQELDYAGVRIKLLTLFSLVLECLRQRRLEPIRTYARSVAGERFRAGFGLGDVQAAMNALEEAIWRRVVQGGERTHLARELGLITTILGSAKDALAVTYVSLASATGAPALDLAAVFEGPRNGESDDI